MVLILSVVPSHGMSHLGKGACLGWHGLVGFIGALLHVSAPGQVDYGYNLSG
jgi:hypothetical protein